MAKTSVFELNCLCGSALVSEDREFSCPTCGQKIWIDRRPAEDTQTPIECLYQRSCHQPQSSHRIVNQPTFSSYKLSWYPDPAC
jgi:predicted RNA-binding Zn-ribbon protein involved in translation (DUF1610 family)